MEKEWVLSIRMFRRGQLPFVRVSRPWLFRSVPSTISQKRDRYQAITARELANKPESSILHPSPLSYYALNIPKNHID